MSGDDRERAILETAERLLGERALHEISVDDLARGAGISRPTFYFYFSSKEAVLLTLIDRMVEEARANRGAALERLTDDPVGSLREAIAGIYMTFAAHSGLAQAVADAVSSSDEIRAVWWGVMEDFVDETAAAIEALRESGVVPPGPPARDLAIALNWMNERVLLATFAGHQPAIAEENVVDLLVGVWLGAVAGAGLAIGEQP